MIPTFLANIEKGVFSLQNKQRFKEYTSSKPDGIYEMTVKKARSQRSKQQNAYYWGVIVKTIADEMGEDDRKYVHRLLAGMFLSEYVTYKGKQFIVTRSTTDLNTKEMEDYHEQCRRFAAIDLNCYIPLPNEIDYPH
jgi:hypothetical protein